MRALAILSVLWLSVGACNTPPKKVAEPDDQIESETCCCKWTPIGAENGAPSYEDLNRMECSEKQGECMDAANCTGAAPSP